MYRNNFAKRFLKIWRTLFAMVAGFLSGQTKREKFCNTCRNVELLDEFYQHKGHKNRIGECKKCRIKKNKKYTQLFLEKNPEYNKKMNKKHRKRKTELQRIYAKEAREENMS